MKRIMSILVALLILVSVPVSQSAAQFFFIKPDQVGNPAPEFSLKNIEGKDVSLSKFRGDDKAILFFWATWCPHCRRELKGLNKDIRRLEKKGIRLATVDVGEDARVVKRYLEKNGLEVEVFMDADQSLAEKYAVVGLPTYFFIDDKGIVRNVSHSLPEDLNKMFES